MNKKKLEARRYVRGVQVLRITISSVILISVGAMFLSDWRPSLFGKIAFVMMIGLVLSDGTLLFLDGYRAARAHLWSSGWFLRSTLSAAAALALAFKHFFLGHSVYQMRIWRKSIELDADEEVRMLDETNATFPWRAGDIAQLLGSGKRSQAKQLLHEEKEDARAVEMLLTHAASLGCRKQVEKFFAEGKIREADALLDRAQTFVQKARTLDIVDEIKGLISEGRLDDAQACIEEAEADCARAKYKESMERQIKGIEKTHRFRLRKLLMEALEYTPGTRPFRKAFYKLERELKKVS